MVLGAGGRLEKEGLLGAGVWFHGPPPPATWYNLEGQGEDSLTEGTAVHVRGTRGWGTAGLGGGKGRD